MTSSSALFQKLLFVYVSQDTVFPDNYSGVPDVMASMGVLVKRLDLRTATYEDYVAGLTDFGAELVFCFVRSANHLRKMVGFMEGLHVVPVLNWFTEDPNFTVQGDILSLSSSFDFWFTIDNRMVPFHQTKAYFLPPAFDERIYDSKGLDRIYDVSFIGQLGHRLSKRMYMPYMRAMAGPRAMLCLDRRIRRNWLTSPSQWTRPKNEEEKALIINQSKIHVGLSRVRGSWEDGLRKLLPDYPIDSPGLFYQPKGRTFEAVGAGAMLLNDYYPELESLFDLGTEAIAFEFGDLTEFEEKLRWYISHDSERERIACAGYRRGRKDHTLEARIQQVFEIVRLG